MTSGLREACLLRAAIGEVGPTEPVIEEWTEWLDLARRERVLPLLFEAVQCSGCSTPELVELATAVQLDVMGAMVRFEHDLVQMVQAFDAAGIESVVLKGVATAHCDYDDPALRQFGDVDVLVRPPALQPAGDVLERLGWRQAYTLPTGHEEFTHALTFRQSGRTEIDLHQRLAHRALGALIDADDCIDRAESIVLAGTTVRVLAPHDRMIHAAVHAIAARGTHRRLSGTADVLVLAENLRGREQSVLRRAERFRVRSLVEAAVASSYRQAALELPAGWRRAMARSTVRRDRLVDRAYLGDRRRPLSEELAHLRVISSWRARRRYVAGYFRVSDDYAAQHGRSGVVAQTAYLWGKLTSSAPSARRRSST